MAFATDSHEHGCPVTLEATLPKYGSNTTAYSQQAQFSRWKGLAQLRTVNRN